LAYFLLGHPVLGLQVIMSVDGLGL